MIEYVLYATKKGEPDWAEEILAVDTKPATSDEMTKIKEVLTAKGYDRIRVAVIDLSVPPDFTKTLNTNKRRNK